VAFPQTPLPVKVYLCPGGNPGLPASWVWTDVTADVRVANGIVIEAGRGDEASEVDAGKCTLTLDNRGGDYCTRNPLGQWYGQLAKNTPLRVALTQITDAFGRAVVNDWDDTDTGQTWVNFGAGGSVFTSDWQVSDGMGRHFVPVASAYRASWLPSAPLLDVDLTITVDMFISSVAGGDIEPANIMLRAQSTGDYYLARVAVNASEVVTCTLYDPAGNALDSGVVSGLTFDGSPLRVRAQIIGSTLRIKAWAAAGVEPAVWHAEAVDHTISVAGGVGVRSGVGAGNSNTKPIEFRYDDLVVEVDRFVGTVPEWPPRWGDKAAADATVQVVASGIFRRLRQGKTPLRSAAHRAISAAAPLAYWPLEDPERAVAAASAVAGVKPMTPIGVSRFTTPSGVPIRAAGAPKFAANVGPGGADKLVSLLDGGLLRGQVPKVAATAWQIDFTAAFNLSAWDPSFVMSPIGWTARGTYGWWTVGFANNSVMVRLDHTPLSGSFGFADVAFQAYDGQPHHYRITAAQAGANITARIYIDGVLRATADDGNFPTPGPVVGTLGEVVEVLINSNEDPNMGLPYAFGHVAYWPSILSTPVADGLVDAVYGWPGETAAGRIIRVCGEEGIPYHVRDSGLGQAMGPQPVATVLDILRQSEAADGGVLAELQAGVRYMERVERYNPPVALALDFANGDIAEAPEPTEDDQRARNDWTVKRQDGGEFQHVDQDHIDLNGRYDDSRTVNVVRDADLPAIAQWLVHEGTVDALRWPRIDLNLAASPELIPAWLACGQGARLTADNPPATAVRDALDVIVEGYVEILGEFDWHVALNCSPAATYQVFQVEDTTLGRLDSSTSVLASGVNASATSLSVSITGALWSTTSEPWDIDVGGERMTVTAVSGATSPQTFTVTRAVNGVSKAHSAGARVRLWRSGVVAR
jgi:hypothetical protein